MPDGNDQDQPLTGERLLREIAWTLDRHGFEIVERRPDCWILRRPSQGDSGLVIQNLVMALGRYPTLARQRRALNDIIAGMAGGGGGAGGVVGKG